MAQHPETKLVKFTFPDGSYIESLTTYSKGDVFYCEKSPWDCPAWNPSVKIQANSSSEVIQSFNSKYGSLFGKKEDKKEN